MRFFATAPKGVENVLVQELVALGATDVRETVAGAYWQGSLSTAYRVCLWSRVANRILLPLTEGPAATADQLYEVVRHIDWRRHLSPTASLAVDFNSVASAITHTQFGAQRTKDAIVDQLRDLTGQRPSIDLERPSVRVNVHVRSDRATIGIDLSGESLHRRGYRLANNAAPLKENLAAAILLRAGWPSMAAQGAPFLDPMCGSGTLPIEAALIAGDVAPGLQRSYWGFLGWRGHEPRSWRAMLDEAHGRARRGLDSLPVIVGSDVDSRAIASARANLSRTGFGDRMRFETCAVSDIRPPADRPGLLVVNPPYGERLGEVDELRDLYGALGQVLRTRFDGWTGWVLTGNEELGFAVGLKAQKAYTVFNSNVRCRLLKFPIATTFRERRAPSAP